MGTDPSPSITVVVVTWNAAALLPRCLDALSRQTLPRPEYRIVVVDNASTDGSAALVTARYPDVDLVELSQNRGFAGGCSAAFETIDSPWVALVNNDAVVDEAFLESLLVAARAADDDVAAWAARVLLDRGPHHRERLVNSTGLEVQRDGNGRDRDYLKPAASDRPTSSVFGFSGSAALLRRAAVEEVGGFDPAYFLYYEDTDLSWRLRLAGWRVSYCHSAIAHHKHGATATLGSDLFVYYNERNRLFTLVKNAPSSLVLAIMMRHPLSTLTKLARVDPATRHRGTIRARAYLDVWRAMPTLVAQRRAPSTTPRRRREVARMLVRA